MLEARRRHQRWREYHGSAAGVPFNFPGYFNGETLQTCDIEDTAVYDLTAGATFYLNSW